jgi:hypothetical protein
MARSKSHLGILLTSPAATTIAVLTAVLSLPFVLENRADLPFETSCAEYLTRGWSGQGFLTQTAHHLAP